MPANFIKASSVPARFYDMLRIKLRLIRRNVAPKFKHFLPFIQIGAKSIVKMHEKPIST